MANYRPGSGSRVHDNWHYYDQLPRRLKEALWDGPCPWDACAILTNFKRLQKEHGAGYAAKKMVELIERWHEIEIARTTVWQAKAPRFQKKAKRQPSPHQQAKATMQRYHSTKKLKP